MLSNLADELLNRLIRENDGRFNADVFQKSYRRLPGFDFDQFEKLLAGNPKAQEGIFLDFTTRLVDACGRGPESGDKPDYDAIDAILKGWPADGREKLINLMAEVVPWIRRDFDAVA